MTNPQTTTHQAVAIARYYINDWHENAAPTDGVSYETGVQNLTRQLSWYLEADLNWTAVDSVLDDLDAMQDAHFGIDSKRRICADAAREMYESDLRHLIISAGYRAARAA